MTDERQALEAIIRAKRPVPLASVDELFAPDVFPGGGDEVDEFAWTYREDRQQS